VDIGDFVKFCKDFEIDSSLGLTTVKIQEIYKKAQDGAQPLDFPHFMNALERVALEVNRINIKKEKRRIREVEKIIN